MKFLVHVTEVGEGCDYTIGCGHKLIMVDAESFDAVGELYTDAQVHGCDGDQGNPFISEGLVENNDRTFKAIKVFLVQDELNMNPGYARGVKDERSAAIRKAELDANERAEFERLRKKYE